MSAAAGNGHQVDYPRAAGSDVAGIRAEAIGIRSDQRQRGEGVDALRMCANASSLVRMGMRAKSRCEEIARRGLQRGVSPGLGGALYRG